MTYDLTNRRVVPLDLDGVTDKAGLTDRCARALALPDWFGRNWDALADSLSDRTVWPEGADAACCSSSAAGGPTPTPAPRSGRPPRRCSPRPPNATPRSPWRSPLEDPPST